MEAAATGIERWREGHAARRVVRISAGAWTSRFLALHIGRLIRPAEEIALDFLTAAARLDIVRRQADIGIRKRAPAEARLSGRRINDVAYAIYRSRDAGDDGEQPWIGCIGDGGITPGARWVAARHAEEIVIN